MKLLLTIIFCCISLTVFADEMFPPKSIAYMSNAFKMTCHSHLPCQIKIKESEEEYTLSNIVLSPKGRTAILVVNTNGGGSAGHPSFIMSKSNGIWKKLFEAFTFSMLPTITNGYYDIELPKSGIKYVWDKSDNEYVEPDTVWRDVAPNPPQVPHLRPAQGISQFLDANSDTLISPACKGGCVFEYRVGAKSRFTPVHLETNSNKWFLIDEGIYRCKKENGCATIILGPYNNGWTTILQCDGVIRVLPSTTNGYFDLECGLKDRRQIVWDGHQYLATDLQPKQQQLENKQPAINVKSIESITGIVVVIIFGIFIYMARGFLINVAAFLGGIYGIYYALTSGSVGWGIFSLIASLIGGFNVIIMIREGDIFETIGYGTSSDLSSHNSYSSQGMGSDSIDSHSEVLVGTQKAGTLYEGSSWLTEEKTGRTDEEGNIYKGSNWLTEEKTGRTDEEGNIYKGSNWLTEEKTGRIDEEGNIYKGSNWLTEEKVGRVDEDGNIYKGSNWLTEEKVGRVEKNDK